MNPRFSALIQEAFFDESTNVPSDRMYHLGEEKIEKFAELIVRECANLVASRPYIDDGNWSHPSAMIKDHFGIPCVGETQNDTNTQ